MVHYIIIVVYFFGFKTGLIEHFCKPFGHSATEFFNDVETVYI